MQSTFKSLLSIPINSSQTKLNSNNLNSNENHNKNNHETTNGSSGPKVYFRPQDLAINSSSRNRGSLEDVFISNSVTSGSNNNNKENNNHSKPKYTSQKASTERLFNGLPVSVTPILTTSNRVSSSVGTARKLVLNGNYNGNTSPTLQARRSHQPSPQCENNTDNIPTRPSSSLNDNKTSTATIYLNNNGRSSVTPISINNNIPTESSPTLIRGISPTNYNTTSSLAKQTLVKTSTTHTEQIDTVIRRIQSPGLIRNEECEEIITQSITTKNNNNNKKPPNNLKSWPSIDRLANIGTIVYDNNIDQHQEKKANNNRDKTPIPMNRSSSAQSNYNNINNNKDNNNNNNNNNYNNQITNWKSTAAINNENKQADFNLNTNEPNKNQSREAYSITGSSNVNSFESNLNNNVNNNNNNNNDFNNNYKSNSNQLNYNENHVNTIINKFNAIKTNNETEKTTPTNLFRTNNHNQNNIKYSSNELLKKKDNMEQYDYNVSLVKSGRLLDAISAASNSIENGLGPVLVKKSKSTKSAKNSSFSTKLNKLNKDLTKSNSNEFEPNTLKLMNNRINVVSTSSNPKNNNGNSNNKHNPKKNDEENNDTSVSFSSERSLSSIENLSSNNKNNENIDKLGKIYSGLNDARIVFKPSSSSDTNSNPNNQKQIEQQNLQKIIDNRRKAQSVDPTLDRPPCRLNYYDSDTNTFSEGLFSTDLNRKSLLHNQKLNNRNRLANGRDLLTDSPNLSDITEGKFDDIEGGHRTSTPNTSKYKRSSTVASPELKNIKKQIESLEKMYFEILKIIDTDKRSLYSDSEERSTTSISSFTPSLSEYKLNGEMNNNQQKMLKKSQSHRSSSFANRNQLKDSVNKDNNEIK